MSLFVPSEKTANSLSPLPAAKLGLGLTDGDNEGDGEIEADGDVDGEREGDRLGDLDGERDVEGEADGEGLTLGETDGEYAGGSMKMELGLLLVATQRALEVILLMQLLSHALLLI